MSDDDDDYGPIAPEDRVWSSSPDAMNTRELQERLTILKPDRLDYENAMLRRIRKWFH